MLYDQLSSSGTLGKKGGAPGWHTTSMFSRWYTAQQITGFLQRLEAGQPAKQIAFEAGVTLNTVYRWKARYRHPAASVPLNENPLANAESAEDHDFGADSALDAHRYV